jgi:hypothetical protein
VKKEEKHKISSRWRNPSISLPVWITASANQNRLALSQPSLINTHFELSQMIDYIHSGDKKEVGALISPTQQHYIIFSSIFKKENERHEKTKWVVGRASRPAADWAGIVGQRSCVEISVLC